jgi:hypothetical protein
MDQIEFNQQRGGGTAGAIGNITHERVHIKSSFAGDLFTRVTRCNSVTVGDEHSVEPNWNIATGALPGEWKPSTKSTGWKIGKIPLQGGGLYILDVQGYPVTFFEVVGYEVNPVARNDLAATKVDPRVKTILNLI